MSSLRLAYCSPLPPARSGIADYSVGLLAELERHCSEIRLFHSGGEPVSNSLQRRYEVALLRDLEKWTRRDATVYQIGNELHFHGAIYEMAIRVPGVVVLHEFALQHLIRGLTVDRRRPEQYVGVMRSCYGESGELAARRYLSIGKARDLWAYPLFEPIVDASQGVIVHNSSAHDRILASRPGAEIEVVPPPLYGSSLSPALSAGERAQLRGELGIPESTFAVGSFGLMSEAKRLEVILGAFASFRQRVPDARLYLIGDASPFIALDSLLQGELGTGVVVPGRQSLDSFVAYMQAVDVAVNLRHPFGGETSAAALRLLGLGQTVIVSDVGWLAEIPDGAVVKIPVDEGEKQMLTAAMWTLAEDRELSRTLGANASRWAFSHHAPDLVADRYIKAIQRLSRCEPRRSSSWLDRVRSEQSLDLKDRIVDEVGEALFELGAKMNEDDLLIETAKVLAEVGLAR